MGPFEAFCYLDLTSYCTRGSMAAVNHDSMAEANHILDRKNSCGSRSTSSSKEGSVAVGGSLRRTGSLASIEAGFDMNQEGMANSVELIKALVEREGARGMYSMDDDTVKYYAYYAMRKVDAPVDTRFLATSQAAGMLELCYGADFRCKRQDSNREDSGHCFKRIC